MTDHDLDHLYISAGPVCLSIRSKQDSICYHTDQTVPTPQRGLDHADYEHQECMFPERSAEHIYQKMICPERSAEHIDQEIICAGRFRQLNVISV